MRLGDAGGPRAGRRRGRDPARHAAQARSTPAPSRSCCCAAAPPPTRTRTPSSWRADRARAAARRAARRWPPPRRPPPRRRRRRQPPIPVIGIGEQSPEMFANPYFKALDVKHVRVITAWDSLRHTLVARRRSTTTWSPRATAGVQRAARLRPLPQRQAQGAPPRAGRARVHQGVPEVQEALPVGEGLADLERGQPLRRADLPQGRAASPASTTTSGTTATAARSSPPTCSTRPTMAPWVQRVPAHGAATTR